MKVGELRKFILESQSEFNPKLGNGVKRKESKDTEDYYDEVKEKMNKYGSEVFKKLKKKEIEPKTDFNRTTLDYNPVIEPSDDFKKKVKAQAMGYTSELEQKNGEERGGVEMDDDGKIYKYITDSSKKIKKAKEEFGHSGLQARMLPKDDKKTLYENRQPKRLLFKHTRFLNEAQMLSRIPEEYKVDGQKIYMEDAKHNEYIVECVKSNFNGNLELKVISYKNKNTINESINRVNKLFDYKTKETSNKIDYNTKLNENDMFKQLMDLSRSK